VRLRSIVVFGAGYVLGTRAGRERYAQITAAAGRAAARLGAVPEPRADGEPTVRLSDYVAAASGNGARRR
jgi:hypothetical protein